MGIFNAKNNHGHALSHLRWEVLRALYAARPKALPLPVLCRVVAEYAGACDEDDAARALRYLEGAGLLVEHAGRTTQAALTTTGIECVEGFAPCPESIARPDAGVSMTARNNAALRWRILVTLDTSALYGVSTGVLLRTVGDRELPVGPEELEREMAYLGALGLLGVDGNVATITSAGTDVVAYHAEAPAGVDRPDKYWREGL